MKTSVLLAIAAFCCASVSAQSDYFVTTTTSSSTQQGKETNATPEVEFVHANFQYYPLDKWVPGMKFMVLPERKDLIIPTFKSAETGKAVSSGELKHKIMEYMGVETTDLRAIRFMFECEGKTYYHEVKNTSLENYCSKPKAGINTLAYLGDIDKAKQLLLGRTLYTRAETYRVDDNTAAQGYSEIVVPENTKVTVTAVGVGTRAFPVKIVVRDGKGQEFYQSVAISKTNCGMVDTEFIMNLKPMWFPNSFALIDANQKIQEYLKEQYGGKDVYVKKDCDMLLGEDKEKIIRYSQFKVKDIEPINNSSYVKMILTDPNNKEFSKEVTFTREDVTGDIAGESENYFSDIFGLGNLRSQYPEISEDHWNCISKGQVMIGMTPQACRMAKGSPLRVSKNHKEGKETWIFEDHTILSFTNGLLEAIN